MRYTVVLEQEEDGGYVASVPALPGCVSQGDTRAEALNNIREAIELYVEDCRDCRRSCPHRSRKEFVENRGRISALRAARWPSSLQVYPAAKSAQAAGIGRKEFKIKHLF